MQAAAEGCLQAEVEGCLLAEVEGCWLAEVEGCLVAEDALHHVEHLADSYKKLTVDLAQTGYGEEGEGKQLHWGDWPVQPKGSLEGRETVEVETGKKVHSEDSCREREEERSMDW